MGFNCWSLTEKAEHFKSSTPIRLRFRTCLRHLQDPVPTLPFPKGLGKRNKWLQDLVPTLPFPKGLGKHNKWLQDPVPTLPFPKGLGKRNTWFNCDSSLLSPTALCTSCPHSNTAPSFSTPPYGTSTRQTVNAWHRERIRCQHKSITETLTSPEARYDNSTQHK